jgi:signal transduction histidine kinase
MEDWNDLLRVVAHDLKTPITSVSGFIQLIQNDAPLTERQTHFSERALYGLKYMEHMVNNLLDLAWLDAGRSLELENIDVRDLIGNAVYMLEHLALRRHLTIEVKVAPRTGKVQSESRRLEQVMINLIVNAIKYNREGGTIWITASGNKQEVKMSVRDTGIGISVEEQGRIFERFFRTKASYASRVEGTGLGLSIVKAMIEKHGGRIWFESAAGEGTTFTFVLPRRHQKQLAAPEAAAHEAEEPIHQTTNSAEGTDYVAPPVTGEQTDAVDDDIQESPQADIVDATDSDAKYYGASQR